jgi:hypothetical protein
MQLVWAATSDASSDGNAMQDDATSAKLCDMAFLNQVRSRAGRLQVIQAHGGKKAGPIGRNRDLPRYEPIALHMCRTGVVDRQARGATCGHDWIAPAQWA